MFSFTVNKNEIIMTESETITSGSVNAYECKFDFSSDWEGLAKTVTFRAGYVKISVILDSTNMCSIPWEVLEKDATQLYCGVRGTVTAYDEEEEAIIPTIYCLLGTIRKGTELGDNAVPPEPSVVDQIMNRIETLDADKQDKLTGKAGQVVGFDADGNAIAQDNESPVYEPGDNISISGNVISSKNSTYSIIKDKETETPGAVAEYHLVDNTKADAAVIVGDSIAIPDMRYNDTEIRADIKSVSALTDELSAATAANTSAISAINDSVAAINTKLDSKQDKLTAGDNVHIENNVISADMYDDTKIRSSIAKLDADKQSRLTAGDHIHIENNVISADMYDDTEIRSDIAKLDAGKQNKLRGAAGQVVGFDADGNAIAQDGGSGTPGAAGVTFTPSVNALGVISWTNDGGRENPEPVNIKGPQGPQGDPGIAGVAGVDGADGFSPTVSVSEISNGHKVTITDKNGPHDFNVTDGTDGSDGAPGAAGVTFTPSVNALGVISWTNDGGRENPEPVNIKGPQGPQGDPGIAGVAGVDGADGFSPTVDITAIEGGHKVTITDKNGPHNFNVTDGTDGAAGSDGAPGAAGADGFSPTVSVSEISNGHKVTITDKNGPHNFNVTDGTDGAAGADGFSPTVSVSEISNGHKVTITDKNGPHDFNVTDGTDGSDGAPGAAGADGFSPTVDITAIEGGHKVTITDKNGPHNFNVTDGTDGPAGPAGADGFSPTVIIEKIPGGSEITITDKNGAHSFTSIDSVPAYTIAEASTSSAEEKAYRLKRDGTAIGSTIVTRRHGIYMNGQAATYYIENSAISTAFVATKTDMKSVSTSTDKPRANIYVIDSFGDLYVSEFNLYRTKEPMSSSSGARNIYLSSSARDMTDLYLLIGNLPVAGSPKCLIQHSYVLEASGNSSNSIISVTDRTGSQYATNKILVQGKVEYRNVLGSSGLFLRLSPLFLAGEKALTLGSGYYALTQL